MDAQVQILAAFCIYFCILFGIGLAFYASSAHAHSFLLGNRSINYFVTAIATQASDMGAWLFMGFPAAVFAHGLWECWTAIGLVVFMFLNWHYVAPRLRIASESSGSLTLSSFLTHSCHDTTGIVRLLAACMALLFFTFYIASALVGLGQVFELAFGLTYTTGAFLGLASAIVYTLLGGFVAIAWCDLFQGLFLLVMILLVPLATVTSLGGWSTIIPILHEKRITLSLFPSWTQAWQGVFLALGWGLGYFGQPHILTNFMGIDNPNNIRYAKYVGITWQIIVLAAAVCIGLTGSAYFAHQAIVPEHLFIITTKQLFSPLIAGFVLCGILAATLSTLDSHIFISGSVIAEDIYKRLMHKTASHHTIMWIARIGSIVVSLIALYIARSNNASIYNLVYYAWAGLGSAFGPLVLMSLYSKRTTAFGAGTGIVLGGLTAALWPYYTAEIPALIPGFFVGLGTMYGISRLS